jgi:phosphonate transport system ATP-binding protein
MCGLVKSDPGSGRIRLGQVEVQSGGVVSKKIRKIRTGIGMIFQQFNLVGRLSVRTNVLLGALGRTPLWRSLVAGFSVQDQVLAQKALAKVGIQTTADQKASTLSGGQQQRAAIARTLVQKAALILADEPIASLDPESARRVMDLLRHLNISEGLTVLVSLHQVDYAVKYCPRTVALSSGRICYDGPTTALTSSMLREIYGSLEEEESFDDTHKHLQGWGIENFEGSQANLLLA